MSRLFRAVVPLVCGVLMFAGHPALAGDSDGKIVQIRIRGPLAEAPPRMDIGALFGEEPQQNLFDLVEALRKARTDDSVRALVFDLDEATLDLAQVQELRSQFEQLRAAEKDVYVYSEFAMLGLLDLASAARFVMMPRGEVFVTGIYSSPMYFKGTLDKIGVTADVIHCGAFKAAGEPFTRTGPSKEAEADTNKILDGIYDAIIADIAKSRKLSPEQVRELLDRGPMSAKQALDAGLVDKLQYREEFSKSLRKKYGSDVKIVRDYGRKKGPEIDFENPFAIFKLFGELLQGPKESKEEAVAVIYVDSMITTGKSEEGLFGGNSGSETIRRAIDKAARDDAIKAVVLRVNSPGGSAIASEVIAEAVKRCKSRKPFVVSMGGVAASGGYYVSCLADCIFAESGTITGSIGVIGMKLVTTEMWGHLGVSMHDYRRGKYADLMSGRRPWSDDERKLMLDMMVRVYDEFKGRVTEGRGKKLKADLESLAGGRIYTGQQALEVGLVDRIGGLNDAIRYAADQANISKYDLRILPAPKSLFDLLSAGMGMKDKDDDEVSVGRGRTAALLRSPEMLSALQALEAVDPRGAAKFQDAIRQLQLFSRENVLLIDPAAAMLN
jgi:protease-4